MTTDSNAPAEARRPRVLVLAGTTGSGKTEVSIPLALRLKGEIINADSRQVYRDLEIGTAKPSPAQLAQVPHHFIGHISIHDRWTAGDFSREGRTLIDEIILRGHLPIVVGGSMLYIKALLNGFFDDETLEPAAYDELRAELEHRGVNVLYQELTDSDPELASKTDPNDHHRILRGLSVFRQSGKRLSDLQKTAEVAIAHPYRLYFLFGDREETYLRVNQRASLMVEEGLVEEVRKLFETGLDENNCNALRTHGYQEIFPYLRGEISRETMIENIQKAVRHYVKRQITWFRAVPETRWIERSFSEPPEKAAGLIAEDFNNK
ncbi:tRNA (adenosine(37)-N6)-dimethylallyltransferase MiaA [bacterium]|nr:MAG: tRNA (adenosine(37)-N6)-dimethylallyltransferase MiaA [bacterium]